MTDESHVFSKTNSYLGGRAAPSDAAEKSIDCVVVGSCCADLLIGPLALEALAAGGTSYIEPIRAVNGGIVPNAGIAMARLGLRVAAIACVGEDEWADVVRASLGRAGVDTTTLIELSECPTSSTAILIDQSTEHHFAHHRGADQRLTTEMLFERLDVFRRAHLMLFGYYAILDDFAAGLPDLLPAIREAGCLTAMDAAGDGGKMQPLDRILPHLDIYVPSQKEGAAQTGETDPYRMISRFRDAGASGLLGVKLGSQGALLSPTAGEFHEIPPVAPPGPVVETVGAGDSFYAGLVTGLLRGMPVRDAGRLGAAAGACCVTEFGAASGVRSFNETALLAGIE